jgi:hypothetical protein
MVSNLWRTGLLALFVAVGLSACLTSDPPKLDPADLTTPEGFAGAYFATKFPEDATSGPNTIDATVEAGADRSYRLTLQEGEHKDAPIVVRFLTLNAGTLLAVMTDDKPDSEAMIAVVTVAANGAWVFRTIDLAADKRDRSLRDTLMRHGASSVVFDTADVRHDEIHGTLSAANLRALLSDPDFVNAIDTSQGFRLSPKH